MTDMENAQESKYLLAVVVLAAENGERTERVLDELYHQDFSMDRLEVVLVGSGAADLQAIGEKYGGRFGSLKVLENPSRRPAVSKNIGLRNSSAPYLLIIDTAAFLPEPSLLSAIVDLFESTGAGCLTGPRALLPDDVSEFQTAQEACSRSLIGDRPAVDTGRFEGTCDSRLAGPIYRRTALAAVGNFDESLEGAEQEELNLRLSAAGTQCYCSPRLPLGVYPAANPAALWHDAVREGKGRFRLGQKHRRHSPADWTLGLGLLFLAGLLVLSLLFPPLASLFRMLIGLYILVVVFFSLYLAVFYNGLIYLLFGPLVFPMVHVGRGIGFLLALHRQMKGQRV